MHYGHPDVFDRIFHITRGGISKASRVINISEDIYAGNSHVLMDFYEMYFINSPWFFRISLHWQTYIQTYELTLVHSVGGHWFDKFIIWHVWCIFMQTQRKIERVGGRERERALCCCLLGLRQSTLDLLISGPDKANPASNHTLSCWSSWFWGIGRLVCNKQISVCHASFNYH